MPHEHAKRWRLKPVDQSTADRFAEELNLFTADRAHPDPRADLPTTTRPAATCHRVYARIYRRPLRWRIWTRRCGVSSMPCATKNRSASGATTTSTAPPERRCWCRSYARSAREPIYHVPHRIEEGYGLNVEGLRRLKERGAACRHRRLRHLQCQRSDAAANAFGLDLVVVDHHQPPDELPPAVAVVNPHRKDCTFPDKGLCAAGLAFYW